VLVVVLLVAEAVAAVALLVKAVVVAVVARSKVLPDQATTSAVVTFPVATCATRTTSATLRQVSRLPLPHRVLLANLAVVWGVLLELKPLLKSQSQLLLRLLPQALPQLFLRCNSNLR
jgi:hypothetical protein